MVLVVFAAAFAAALVAATPNAAAASDSAIAAFPTNFAVPPGRHARGLALLRGRRLQLSEGICKEGVVAGKHADRGSRSWNPCASRSALGGEKVTPPASSAPTVEAGADAVDDATEPASLEVVVVGGGVVGLFFALSLAASLRGRQRIRVYDSRWVKDTRGVRWRESDADEFGRTERVVTLQSSVLSAFQEDVKQRLYTCESHMKQWPLQFASPAKTGYPVNFVLGDLEEQLLDAAQQPPYSDAIELFPDLYDAATHARLTTSDPFHALVAADGYDGLSLRSAVLDDALGEPGEYQDNILEELLGLAFDLGDVGSLLNIADCTAITMAQKRYMLNASSARSGYISMRLAKGELEEASELVGLVDQDTSSRGGALWQRVCDGLRLYGIPPDALKSISRYSTNLMSHGNYYGELTDYNTPADEGCMPHPYGFLVGDSADAVNEWPGRELTTALKGADSLARLVAGMHVGLRSGWPVQACALEEHGQAMLGYQNLEARVRGLHTLVPHGVRDGARPIGVRVQEGLDKAVPKEKFFSALKQTHARLSACHLPAERIAELSDVDSLCDRVLARGLSPETYSVLASTGTWVLDPFSRRQEGSAEPEDVPPPLGKVEEKEEEDDEHEGMSEASSSSEVESAKSLYNRGVKYLKGLGGFEKDDAHAAACFLRSAAQQHTAAQYAIGVMFLDGRGVEKDMPRAAKWLMRAAQQGHAKAQYNLGQMLKYGDGVQRDPIKARAWTQHAASQGHVKALLSGDVVAFGVGPWLDIDVKKIGVETLFKKANAGDENAAMRLALMLYDGEGVAEDKAKAAYWFMQAGQKGVAEARYRLSGMLFTGDGVEVDEEYAMTFLTQAAEQGHPESMYNLGVKLYHGEGLKLDRAAAAGWFLQAAEAGMPEAQNNIGWMMLVGDGARPNVVEGRRWLEKAADAGSFDASMTLQSIRG